MHICTEQTCRAAAASAEHLVSDFDQLVRVSRLYYELGETQNAIAELMGVTRPQVSKLLKRARAEGIVEIRIVDSTTATSPAGDALRRSYGLDAVHLAPTIVGPEDLTRRMVGRLAAQVLRTTVRDGAIIGVGDGASVSATADAFEETASPVAATVLPLCGGHWSTGPEREPYRRIAEALGGQPRGLMAPGLVDDAATKDALVAHAGVRAVVDLWDRLDVALFGIGGPSWSVAAVGADTERQLESAEAVGEVLIAPFDLDGRFVCPAMRERVIAFDARALGRVPVAIGVASGETKVRAILGAPSSRRRPDPGDRCRDRRGRRRARCRDAGAMSPNATPSPRDRRRSWASTSGPRRSRPASSRSTGSCWASPGPATGWMSAGIPGWAEQDPGRLVVRGRLGRSGAADPRGLRGRGDRRGRPRTDARRRGRAGRGDPARDHVAGHAIHRRGRRTRRGHRRPRLGPGRVAGRALGGAPRPGRRRRDPLVSRDLGVARVPADRRGRCRR